MTRYRAHPITIAYNLKRFFVLIIIPLLRGFILALRGDFAGWLGGAWLDILVVLVMVLLSVLNWLYYTYGWDNQAVYLAKGWFRTSRVILPWENITTVSLVEKFWLRPVSAVYLRVDSLGGNRQRSDIVIYLQKEHCDEFVTRQSGLYTNEDLLATYKPPYKSIFLLSLLSTNSFGGVVYIVTFISQSGKILGRQFQDMLLGTFEDFARKFANTISPAAVATAIVLALAWFIGFVLTVFRYRNFTVLRTQHQLKNYGGLFTKRRYTVAARHIIFLDIRQNLAFFLFGLYSLYFSAVGNAKDKNNLVSVIPLERRASFKEISARLFPRLQEAPLALRPHRRGLMRYLWDPLLVCGGILFSMLLTHFIIPSWLSFAIFVGCMALIPSIIFLAVRFTDYRTSGLSYANDLYTVKYSRHFTLHTLVIPKASIVKIKIRQSFWQKAHGHCDLILYTKAESRRVHKVRAVEKTVLCEFLSIPMHV